MSIAARRLAPLMPPPPRWWAQPEGPHFVGRAPEVSALDDAWSRALAGRRQVVNVQGEAGIGKSRLVAEACAGFGQQRATVLVGFCMPDAPAAYEPFRVPLLGLFEHVDGLSGADRQVVRDLLSAPVMTGGSPATGTATATSAFDAVAEGLRRAAAEGPIALVIEDLHWATRSTLDLLGWVVRRTPEARLLIVLTSRNTRVDVSPALSAALVELYRQPGVGRVELGGLTADDISGLVTAEAGVDPTHAPSMAERLLAQTAGNPFLLQEICRELRTRGDTSSVDAGLHVPEMVRELIAPRFEQFPDAERRILEAAAVLGDQFPTSLLEAVTESAAETMPALDRATDSGLLLVLPDTQGFRFPHALARQCLLDLTPPGRLATTHGRVADVLEARLGRNLPEVERLAHHNLRAFGRAAQARDFLIQAAKLADQAWAYTEAARHLQRAADLSETVGERHALLLRSADCLQSAGEYAAARDLAADVAAQAVDADTRLAAAILVEEGATLVGGDLRTVELLVDALTRHPGALDDLDDLDDPRFLRGLVGLSRGLWQVVESPDAVRLYDAVLSRARALGNAELLGQVLAVGLPLALGQPGRTDEALRAARELTTLARPAAAQELGTSGFFRCLLGLRAGNLDDVRAGLVDYQYAYDVRGHLWFDYWPRAVDFDLRLSRGDFAGAQRVAGELLDWVIKRCVPGGLGHYGLRMFQVMRETGQLARISDLVTGDESLADCFTPGLLALYTELGMARPAQQLLDRLTDPAVLRANRSAAYFPTALAFFVDAALPLKDVDALRRLRPLVAEHRGMHLVSDQFVTLSGSADRYLGMIDDALGDADPLPSFEAAEELALRCDFVVERALTLTARARHLARTRGPGAPEVAVAVREARALAEPIGQVRVLRALEELGPLPAGRRRALGSGLTARELQVLTLLCDGASNREIAERLVISENTAANHVRSILTKTGSPNRTRAAILAVSRGWVPPAD